MRMRNVHSKRQTSPKRYHAITKTIRIEKECVDLLIPRGSFANVVNVAFVIRLGDVKGNAIFFREVHEPLRAVPTGRRVHEEEERFDEKFEI